MTKVKVLIGTVIVATLISLTMAGYAAQSNMNSLGLKAADTTLDSPMLDIQTTAGTSIFKVDGSGNIYTDGYVIKKELFAYASVSDSTSVLSSTRIDSLSGTASTHQNDCGARNLNLALYCYSINSGATGTIGVYGYDANMNAINESVSVTILSNTPTSLVTNKAFLLIDHFTADSVLRGYTSYTDTITIGFGPALGLTDHPLGDTIIGFIDTNNVGTNGDPPGTYNSTYNTYTPASALSGACCVVIYAARVKIKAR